MDQMISVCGSDCASCYCLQAGMCKGCSEQKGIVFHTGGRECAIYNCCHSIENYANCLDCKKIPCLIWKETRDPKFTDSEFERNVQERIARLKKNH